MQSRPVALLACDESSGSPRCHRFVQQHHCGFGLSKARHLSRFSTPLSPSIMKPSEALTIPMQHTPIPIIRMALERGGGVVHMRRPTVERLERASAGPARESAGAPCWGTLVKSELVLGLGLGLARGVLLYNVLMQSETKEGGCLLSLPSATRADVARQLHAYLRPDRPPLGAGVAAAAPSALGGARHRRGAGPLLLRPR